MLGRCTAIVSALILQPIVLPRVWYVFGFGEAQGVDRKHLVSKIERCCSDRKFSVVQNLYKRNAALLKLLKILSLGMVELVGIEPFQWIENIQLADSTMFSKVKKGTNSNSEVQIGTRTSARLFAHTES